MRLEEWSRSADNGTSAQFSISSAMTNPEPSAKGGADASKQNKFDEAEVTTTNEWRTEEVTLQITDGELKLTDGERKKKTNRWSTMCPRLCLGSSWVCRIPKDNGTQRR